MARIGQNIGNIQQQHQANRANNDAQAAKTKGQTEAAKQKERQDAGSAFAEINNNHSDTLTGAIKEGAADALNAGKETLEYIGSAIYDGVSDVATDVGTAAKNVGDHIAEGFESACSFVGDCATAVGGFFKGLFGAGAKGAQEALDNKYGE